jgi:hypothetical protein
MILLEQHIPPIKRDIGERGEPLVKRDDVRVFPEGNPLTIPPERPFVPADEIEIETGFPVDIEQFAGIAPPPGLRVRVGVATGSADETARWKSRGLCHVLREISVLGFGQKGGNSPLDHHGLIEKRPVSRPGDLDELRVHQGGMEFGLILLAGIPTLARSIHDESFRAQGTETSSLVPIDGGERRGKRPARGKSASE